MKTIHSKKLNKLIICIVATLLLCNFAMPNFAYAKTDTEDGGPLFEALAKFVTYICDNIMQWLQDSFVSMDEIEQPDGKYNFQYSPGIIFSGTVPALDVNFIDPKETEPEFEGHEYSVEELNKPENWRKVYHGVNRTITSESNPEVARQEEKYEKTIAELIDKKEESDGGASSVWTTTTTKIWKASHNQYYKSIKATKSDSVTGEWTVDYTVYTIGNATYESTASKLQTTIATWYKVLRRIALVGLLSVLVYIGIRIVLTASSPQDKAKYKKMMTDWLVAICLLFTLHYIMSLTLTATGGISKIFNTGETDELLNTLRYDIRNGTGSEPWGSVAGEVIMYATMVIFTITFTIQYIKRVIYMAFFTMIAPLITLTYPLDKIKDGQAQAFTMWLREFTFNALIQIVHLVIYYVLISSALELVGVYPLYAIIVLFFMKKAEGLIRRMFGFDKAETVSALGAAATGGLVMTAINSIKKPPKPGGEKGNSSDGGESKPVRTVQSDPVRTMEGANNNSNPAEENSQNPNETTESIEQLRTRMQQNSMEEERNRLLEEFTRRGMTEDEANEEISLRNQRKNNAIRNIKGAMSVGRKYVDPAITKGLRTVGGVALGAAGGTIGFATGVAQGDFEKAITNAAAGGAAGYYSGQKLINGAGGLANAAGEILHEVANAGEIGDLGIALREGMYGEEDIQAILDAGIINRTDVDKILKNNNGDINQTIEYYRLAKSCPQDIYNDDVKLENYLKNLGLSDEKSREIKDNIIKFR